MPNASAAPKLDATLFDTIRASTVRVAMACFRDDEGQPIAAMPHHRLMVTVMEADYLGFTVINAPPGFAKSWWVDFFLARRLALNPDERVIYVSKSEQLARKQSLMLRDTFDQNPYFRLIFPAAIPNKGKGWGVDQWFLQRKNLNDPNPSFAAYGIDGMVVGSRADLIVFDDINDQKQIRSETQRQQVVDWISNTARSRLTPKSGRIINVQTRWHEADATGWCLTEHWTQLRLQALADNDGPEQWATLTVWSKLKADRLMKDLTKDGWRFEGEELGSDEGKDHRWEFRIFLHANGPSLWPERFVCGSDLDTDLFRIRISQSPQDWATTYQSLPVPEGGSIIPVDAFQLYAWGDRSLRDQDWVVKVQSWDTATGKSNLGDFSVCTTWGLHRNGSLWLLDLYRERIPFPTLKLKSVEQFTAHTPNLVVIEDASSGTALIQEFKAPDASHMYRIPVLAIPPKTYGVDKVSRVHSITGYIAAGKVWIPKDAPWSADFINEAAMFPFGRHDDQVDSMVLGIRQLLKSALATAIAEQPGETGSFFGNILDSEFIGGDPDDLW